MHCYAEKNSEKKFAQMSTQIKPIDTEPVNYGSRKRNRYQFNSKNIFGKGAFGIVYRCVDNINNRDVAVKLCKCGHNKEVEALIRLRGTKNVIELLHHHRIHAQLQLIVMEAACGGELYSRVKTHGYICEEMAQLYFGQMVHGVKGMHRKGVVHRDLKLENVVFAEPNSEKLYWVDLGLADTFERMGTDTFYQHKLDTIVGSKSYVAPEALLGAPFDGFKADVWSLGICLFAMVVGTFPVDCANSSNVHVQIIANAQRDDRNGIRALLQAVAPSCDLSKELLNLLNALLQVDPTQRPSVFNLGRFDWLQVDNR